MQAAKFVIFSGNVQGVGFRYTAHRIAFRYELTGYVRNRSDGKVELLLQGKQNDIENCLLDIKETFGHYIRSIEEKDAFAEPHYASFLIKV